MSSSQEVHVRIFIIIFIVIISSTAERVKNLTGTEGGSITFPDPVMELGFLLRTNNIAMITGRELKILDNTYTDRVLWDSSSGLFTITGLQRKDSGIYSIDPGKGRAFKTEYNLTVYESAPTPEVRAESVSPDSCTVLCSVERLPAETILLWYRGEDILNQSSSVPSLPLTVHRQDFTSSYSCVAANPAGNKTVLVDVNTICTGENPIEDTSVHHWWFLVPMALTLMGVAVYVLSNTN